MPPKGFTIATCELGCFGGFICGTFICGGFGTLIAFGLGVLIIIPLIGLPAPLAGLIGPAELSRVGLGKKFFSIN
jgi:hypothetical protein